MACVVKSANEFGCMNILIFNLVGCNVDLGGSVSAFYGNAQDA